MSPLGLFRNLTTDQLTAMGVKIADWMLNGQWTSTSGGGKSGSKNWLTPERAQVEYNAEVARRAGTPRVTSVIHQVGCNQVSF